MIVSLKVKVRGFLKKPQKNDLNYLKNSLKTQGFSRSLEKNTSRPRKIKDLKASKIKNEALNRFLGSRVLECSPRKTLKVRGKIKGYIFDVFDHPNGH